MAEQNTKGFTAEGRYSGFVTSKRVEIPKDKQKQPKAGQLQLVCVVSADQWKDPDSKEWVKLDAPIEAVAFINLMGAKGKNVHQIDAIRGAFKWDGQDIRALHEMDVSKERVQIVVGYKKDEQGNFVADAKTNQYVCEINWIQSMGAGQLKPTAPEELDSIVAGWTKISGGPAPATKPAAAAQPEGFSSY